MSLERDSTALRKDGRDRGSLTRQTLLVKVIEKARNGDLGRGREVVIESGGGAKGGVGRVHKGERRVFMSNE